MIYKERPLELIIILTYTTHRTAVVRDRFLEDGYEEAFRAWPPSLSEELGAFAAVPRRGDQTFNLILKKIKICSSDG